MSAARASSRANANHRPSVIRISDMAESRLVPRRKPSLAVLTKAARTPTPIAAPVPASTMVARRPSRRVTRISISAVGCRKYTESDGLFPSLHSELAAETKLSPAIGIPSDNGCAGSINEHARTMLDVRGSREYSPAGRSELVSLLGPQGRRVSSVRSTEPLANIVVQGGRSLA